MSKEIRGIITGLNVTVSVLMTETLIRYVFGDLYGIRLVIIAVTLAICVFNGLNCTEQYFIHRKGKAGNEGQNERIKGESDGGDLSGMPWFQMRFGVSEQKDGNPGNNIKKVQKRAGSNPAEPIAFNRKGDGYRQG